MFGFLKNTIRVAAAKKATNALKEFPIIISEIKSGRISKTIDAILERGNALRKESNRIKKGQEAGHEYGRHPSKKEGDAARRKEKREVTETSGSENWDLKTQQEKAWERARHVVNNMRSRFTGGKERRYVDQHGVEREGNAYFLTKDQEDKIREILYPIKLREIQAGTLRDDLLEIGHRTPQWGVHSTGQMNTRWSGGDPKSSGFTTWENITDDAGNLNLVKASENKAAGTRNIIPEDMRHPVVDTGRMTWDEYDAWRIANPDARSFPITDKKNAVAAGVLGLGGTGSANASNILDYGFTPEELQERKDLAASRRQWVGERLHLLNPILSSLTGPFSKGGEGSEQGWRRKLLDPTWRT